MNLKNDYEQNGYFILENIFNSEEIKSILNLIEGIKNNNYNNTLDENNNLLRLENFLNKDDQLKKVIEIKIKPIIKECIGCDTILFKDKLIIKNPGSQNSLIPHVDGLFKSFNYRLNKETFGWYTYSSKFINVSIMLTDNNEDNGCLYINPIKSNDINYIYNTFIINNQNNRIDMNKISDGFKPIIGSKGSVLFFNPLCIHYSLNNCIENIRKNIYLTYSDAKDGDNYNLNLEDKKLVINNLGKHQVEKLSSGNDYFNIVIVGLGNIGMRYLEALIKLNYYSLNITVILNSNKTINLELPNNINLNYLYNINDIDTNIIDLIIISTCSDIRLSLIQQIIDNKSINIVHCLILEKVVFNNIEQYYKFNKIYPLKIKKVYINSFWNSYLNILELKEFKYPIINIKSNNKWGICCNLIHILIYLGSKVLINNIKFNTYNIIPAKRNNFNEIICDAQSKYLNIIQEYSNDKPYLKIEIVENNKKIIYTLEPKNTFNIKYFIDNKLIKEYCKQIKNVSEHLVKEFNCILIKNYSSVTLCDNNSSLNAHEKLFDIFKSIKNINIT